MIAVELIVMAITNLKVTPYANVFNVVAPSIAFYLNIHIFLNPHPILYPTTNTSPPLYRLILRSYETPPPNPQIIIR